MRHRISWIGTLGVTLTILLFIAARLQVVAEPVEAEQDAVIVTNAPEQTNLADAGTAPDSDAPVTKVAAERTLPANIKPSNAVNEVIKLANSGVAESVMLAYVTNSAHTFNLGAEEIIYLNDIGVPGAVVTAMIQRDQELKGSLSAAYSAPAEPVPPAGPLPPDQVPPPGTAMEQPPAEAPLTPPDDSGDMFYDSLAPYGNWVDVEGYGRCWQPTVVVVNSGWQPYFDCGHWVYSDCGWYWLSDYSWGWAPFHYGSWFRHAHLGWCWVPGRVWGPSWVSWRYNHDYCGWAPLPPGAHFAAGAGITFHGRGIWDREDFGLRPNHYRFIAWNHFNDRELRPRGLPLHEAARVYTQTTVATRINGDGHHVINNGLPPSQVVAATHRPIHTVALRESSRAESSGGRVERFENEGQTLAVYRPRVERTAPIAAGHPGSGIQRGYSPGSTVVTHPAAASWGAQRPVSTGSVSSEVRSERGTTARQQGSPLILRGSQPSVLKETAPPSSLVILGRGNNPTQAPTSAHPAETGSPTASWAWSAQNQSSIPGATENAEPPRTPTEAKVPERPAWRGSASSSPQPSWFGANNGVRPAMSPGMGETSISGRTYQPVQRPPMSDIPRYSAGPNYVPQRSYSAPAWSAPARSQSYSAPAVSPPSVSPRPAPPAPSAPASAPASHSSSSSSSNRGGR
ncbi:MAG TPA: DUF6600 domain-containing protein [Patescibacteria group bacterium]|nr:DUF6600 domain-containing protein [Patescibacteria group bacterium]